MKERCAVIVVRCLVIFLVIVSAVIACRCRDAVGWVTGGVSVL